MPTGAAGLVPHGIVSIPASWPQTMSHTQSPNGLFTNLQTWSNAGGTEQLSVDVAPRFGWSLNRVTSSSLQGMNRRHPAMVLRSNGQLRLCNGTPGWRQIFNDATGDGIVYVYGITPSRLYVAQYTYSGSPGPSVDGEAAVESLCPPRDPAFRLPPAPLMAPPGWNGEDPYFLVAHAPGSTFWIWNAPPTKPWGRLIVAKLPLPSHHMGLADVLVATIARSSPGQTTVLRRRPLVLCHSLDAMSVTLQARSGIGAQLIESLVTIAGRHAFTAIYLRPAGTAAAPEAERSLHSFCPAGK